MLHHEAEAEAEAGAQGKMLDYCNFEGAGSLFGSLIDRCVSVQYLKIEV